MGGFDTRAITRHPVARFARLADDVADGIRGGQDAGRFIERVRGACGGGDELWVAVEQLALRTAAYRRGWLRALQKVVERT